MKKSLFLSLLLGLVILAGCDAKDQCLDMGGKYDETSKTCQRDPQGLVYSNLVDKASQDEVKTAFLNAGIAEANVEKFFDQVAFFNQTAGTESLVASGFAHSESLTPEYDMSPILDNLEKKSPDFNGYNCRITSFNLMKDLISIAKPELADATQLFMDKEALEKSPQKVFTDEESQLFESFYSLVPTPTTKDQNVHFENIKKSWSEKGITFKDSKASLISVWMHSHFEGEQDFLFIGHIGVLIENGDHYLFVEKLAFDEPYQAIKFRTRADVAAYLRAKYDTEYNQPTARPILMQNDQVLDQLFTD